MMTQERIPVKDAEDEGTARVLALQGYLSKYVQEMEMAPGWHRLPNGVAVYSDPVATQLIDPSGSIATRPFERSAYQVSHRGP